MKLSNLNPCWRTALCKTNRGNQLRYHRLFTCIMHSHSRPLRPTAVLWGGTRSPGIFQLFTPYHHLRIRAG